MDQWVTIRTLRLQNPRLGTRKIAQALGVSRNTVKRALVSEEGPEYRRPPVINPEIEPFKEYLYERLIVGKLRVSRVLNDLRSKGYRGSQSAFYRYTSHLARTVRRVAHPYETAPGEQGQFDWSPYTVMIGGVLVKVYVFIFILGYSRYRIYTASLSTNAISVFDALEESLRSIGGAPLRVQTDNAKCFVLDPSPHHIKWNPHYLAFCGHYTIQPSRSLPRHPWSKGKVENPFDYLEDHFIDGNTFASFEEFLDRLHKFQEEVNSPRTRDHQATSSDTLRRRALGAARVAALTIREPSRRGEEADHRLSCLIRRFALQRSALLCQAGCLAPHFQRIPT